MTRSLTNEQTKTLARIGAKLHLLGYETAPNDVVSVGPIVTAYRFTPKGKTKFSQLESLGDDLAIFLGVEDVLIKRLPGESSVAFFIPNEVRHYIDFKDTVSDVWTSYKSPGGCINIPLNFGVDYLGKPFIEDLTTLPHLLIAGSTGAGKSTLMASIITSLAYVCTKDEVNLVLSDTKGVEFPRFHRLPHVLLTADSVVSTLNQMDFLLGEVDSRLRAFAQSKTRNISEYNERGCKVHLGPHFPFIVFIIDELADLLTDQTKEENDDGKRVGKTRGRQCEDKLATIVQKARATGIHVIAGTQRPSVDIVGGTIKANFPARLAFRLPTGTDSRTVLQTYGAEHLLSPGDMLYSSPSRPGLTRLHAPFTKNEDIDAAVAMAEQRR